MRDITFRGKAVDSGEWVYGSYVEATEALTRRLVSLIIPKRGDVDPDGNFPAVEIVPSTVGQYTGLRDRNGAMIFEGDIIRERKKKPELWEIRWINKYSRFAAWRPGTVFAVFAFEMGEVVGNVHDNPGLLHDAAD